MMGGSALSSVCRLGPPTLPTIQERASEKSPGGDFSPYGRKRWCKPAKWCGATVPEAYLPDGTLDSEDIIKVEEDYLRSRRGDDEGVNPSGRVCGCGTAQSASTSGSSGRALPDSYVGRVSFGTYLKSCDLFFRGARRVRLRGWIATEPWHLKHPEPSEKARKSNSSTAWDADSLADGARNWRRRRATLAAAAVAGLLSLSLSSSAAAAAAEIVRLDAAGVEPLQALRLQTELEGARPVSTPPPLRSPEPQNAPAAADGASTLAAAADLEDSGFQAWREVQAEVELEAEKRAVPAVRPVPKSTPAKKVVAAGVAVAVAGSVAGAASAATHAVASSGGSAVTTSLTVLHAGGAFPGSSLLARAVQHFGGGGVAGAVGATVVYPLDTIKTRMQAQSVEGEERQYKDEIDCFKQLVANEGPASLYSGLVPQLLGIAPEKAMKFTVNEALLEVLESMMPGARIWALEFIAGGGGGFSQVVFTNPMEIVKVRLQTQSKGGGPRKNTWDVVKELGLKGLYDGAGVTMARDVPSSAIFFACYTLLRQLYPEQSFLSGCAAAIPATILGTPMDIIKTRLQKEPAPGEPPCTDWWQCLQEIVRNEGPQALFKGSVVRVLRTSPQFGITLMIYAFLCEGP